MSRVQVPFFAECLPFSFEAPPGGEPEDICVRLNYTPRKIISFTGANLINIRLIQTDVYIIQISFYWIGAIEIYYFSGCVES